jgi:hypothetical protein
MANKFKVCTVTYRQPYHDMNDPRVADLFEVRDFLVNWIKALKEKYPEDWKRKFVPMELYIDSVVTIDGFLGQMDFASRRDKGPSDFNMSTQNNTEGSFSLSRSKQQDQHPNAAEAETNIMAEKTLTETKELARVASKGSYDADPGNEARGQLQCRQNKRGTKYTWTMQVFTPSIGEPVGGVSTTPEIGKVAHVTSKLKALMENTSPFSIYKDHAVRPKLLAHLDTKAGQDALLKYMNMLEADLQLIHVPVKGNLNSTVWNNIREGEESYLRSAKVYVGWVQLLAGVLTFLTQLKWYIGCCIYCCSNTNGRHPPVVAAGRSVELLAPGRSLSHQ